MRLRPRSPRPASDCRRPSSPAEPEDARLLPERTASSSRRSCIRCPRTRSAALASTAEEPELSALCFDPVPGVVRAVIDNPRAGLAHARLIAAHHGNAVGLDAVGEKPRCCRTEVQRLLLRNPQTSAPLLQRILSRRRLADVYNATQSRELPERNRAGAMQLLRRRFSEVSAEERVELILRTEGRALAALCGLSLDGKSAALLCARTFTSALIVENLARWPATPPPVILHLLKQPLLRQLPALRAMLKRHPNCPASASLSGFSRHLIRISAAAHGLVRTPRPGLGHTAGMNTTVMNPVKAFTLIALGLAIAAMGIYVADADDAPGAAVIGMLLMVVGVVLGVRAARNRLPTWAARTALAVGVVVAAFAAFLTHGVVVTAPLFPQSQEVPSVVDSAPSPQYTAAVERARQLVRAAVLEQNLPGVSVAVGAGGTVVWAEGFGWRDVVTRAPVTPDTRFNIGTAASGSPPPSRRSG